MQGLDASRDGHVCVVQDSATITTGGELDEGITDVIAAHFDHIHCVGRGNTAVLLQERVDLCRKIHVSAILARPGGAHGVVARAAHGAGKGRPHAAGQPSRAGKVFDPRRAVAEVLAAAGVRSAGNQQVVEQVLRRRVRSSPQGERVAGIRQAGSENDDALVMALGRGRHYGGDDGQHGCCRE